MAITIDYEVGDQVYVAYPFNGTTSLTSQTRIVKEVCVVASGDEANVYFESGAPVVDSDANTRVFTLTSDASNKIISDYSAALNTAALAASDLSVVSTGGLAATGIGLVDTP